MVVSTVTVEPNAGAVEAHRITLDTTPEPVRRSGSEIQ
jgi:hypothetical protein